MRRTLLSLLAALLASSAHIAPADAQQQCPGGRSRIVGGELARIENWPGQAALRLHAKAAGVSFYFCTGTAISDRWVLTAAHCLEPYFEGALSNGVRDSGGEWHQGELQVVLGVGDLTKATPQDTYVVERVVAHEQFRTAYAAAKKADDQTALDELSPQHGNDIALVRLARPWRGAVARLLLVPDADPTVAGTQVRVAGYGRTVSTKDKTPEGKNKGGLRMFKRSDGTGERELFAASEVLNEVAVATFETGQCRSHYLHAFPDVYPPLAVGAGQICAGWEQSAKDSCQGDSGGPLAIIDSQGCPRQVGVVSWGVGCADDHAYSIYTRVSHYADWIQGHTGTLPSGAPFQDRVGTALTPAQLKESLTQLEALLRPAKGRVMIGVRGGNRVRLGDKVEFEAASAVAGRLVVLDIDANRDVVLIYPNKFVPPSQAGSVRPLEKVTVPGPGYAGFSGFLASEPPGKGILLALVVPESFDIERFAAPGAAVSRGFASLTGASSYLMRLLRQIDVTISAPSQADPAALEAWGYGMAEYDIVK